MDDLISRQAVIDAAHKNYDTILDFKSDGHTVAGSFEDIINALPSAQPDVIRCKDCKHYEWTGNRIPEEQTWWCYKYNTEMGNNDYCSHGERRGGDGNG